MANFGWADLRLKFGKTGGNWYDIKDYVDEQSMAKLKAMIEDWHPKGSAWKSKKPVGTKEWDGDIELGGLFDTTATSGPDALFHNNGANIGATGKVAESWDGGANWVVISVIVQDYLPEPKQGGLTRFKVTLVPYGAPTYTATEPTGTV